MVPFFVQIKCHLGKSYDVANRIADAEIASEIYSTAGEFDLMVKFYVDDKLLGETAFGPPFETPTSAGRSTRSAMV